MYDQDGNKMGQTLTRHYDSTDYGAIVTRTAEILPLSVVTANWGYDSDHFALILAQNVCLVLSYLDRLVWPSDIGPNPPHFPSVSTMADTAITFLKSAGE